MLTFKIYIYILFSDVLVDIQLNNVGMVGKPVDITCLTTVHSTVSLIPSFHWSAPTVASNAFNNVTTPTYLNTAMLHNVTEDFYGSYTCSVNIDGYCKNQTFRLNAAGKFVYCVSQ